MIMNKKFSTLLAGVALFGAMSANAQTSVNTDIKLKEGQNEELYQLKIDGGFLTSMKTESWILYRQLLLPTFPELCGVFL